MAGPDWIAISSRSGVSYAIPAAFEAGEAFQRCREWIGCEVRRPASLDTGLGLSLVALFFGLLVGSSGCTSIKRFAYEGFGRDDWQQPDRVVEALGISPGDRVADLGAGGGYFTFRLARAVGKQGRVYSVDVDEGMLKYIRKRAASEELPQVETVLASFEDSGLPAGAVDLVFMSNTYHHISERPTYFARLKSSLRPRGRLAVVERIGEGFPKGHAMPPEEIREELAEAGFQLSDTHDFLERQSFQVFVPRD
jgi:arsenite methyltransferase